jgi:hypothetical protein
VLIVHAGAQALAIAAYLRVNELSEFYTLAVIFGVAYGGGMPLYASLRARLLRPAHHGHGVRRRDHVIQSRNGARSVCGGWVFDTFHNYAWLVHRLRGVCRRCGVARDFIFRNPRTHPHWQR